ncbi:CBS domain-containing protein [Neobacillus notoginsengisoli]|uniref:CBS domain-containing protein n=1 Tax=Neobacillus notoginsengisoli TaxID=1578198 RepID=A0A417YS29_9BACI|nr:CBS domain-containing protein [Neobacillus notoginsengisoli]RHW38107.1 CBS domain-containing protein [Neobacillus notoginsengisoli]
MKIKEVMTTEVETCSPDTPIHEIAKKMKELNVGVIPICEGDELKGLATDRDLVLNAVAENLPWDTPVSKVMTGDPVMGTIDMSAKEAANLMADVQIRRLPIVEQGRLIGIVSLGDLAVEKNLTNHAGEALEKISEPSKPEK